MNALIDYLKRLPAEQQQTFASQCDTSVAYLKKACYKKQKLGEKLCIAIEKNSDRKVTCEDIRPDVDWAYLRKSVAA